MWLKGLSVILLVKVLVFEKTDELTRTFEKGEAVIYILKGLNKTSDVKFNQNNSLIDPIFFTTYKPVPMFIFKRSQNGVFYILLDSQLPKSGILLIYLMDFNL